MPSQPPVQLHQRLEGLFQRLPILPPIRGLGGDAGVEVDSDLGEVGEGGNNAGQDRA